MQQCIGICNIFKKTCIHSNNLLKYYQNEMTKLELYKRISGVWTKEDYEDMLDELTDRFGEPPQAVMNLLAVARLKAQAHEAMIASIGYKNKQLQIEIAPGADVKTELLEDFLVKYLNNIRIVGGTNPGFVVDLERKGPKSFLKSVTGIVEDISTLIRKE